MKKLIASIVALIAINASAYDVTNTVTIVSNIYNRISEEHWITNNIKNTHSNYYYTNNVYTVSNVTLLVSQQTFKTNTTVNLDVSQQAIADAREQANRAAEAADNADDFANAAAGSATTAQSHAADAKNYRDEAEYYAEQAHGQVQPIIDEGDRQIARVQSDGNTQIARIEDEKQWFEDHFGQMITNIEVTVTTNIYHNEDQVARSGVAKNEANIAEAKQGVTDSFAYTTAVSNKMENAVSDAKQGVIEAKQGVAEAKQGVTEAKQGVAEAKQGVTDAKQGVTDSFAYTTAVSNKIEKMNKIYNDGSGYSMWMKKMPLMQTIKVYRSGYLLVTVTFDPSKYIDNVSGGSFEYTDFTRTPTSLAPHSTPSDFRLYKSKSNNRFLMIDRYNQSSSSTISYTIYWNTGSSDPTNVGTGNGMSGTTGISGTSSREEFEQTPYYVLSDLTIRKADKTIITKIVTEMALNAISNWVEQTFQKK